MMMVWLAGAAYLAFATLVPTYGLGLIGWIILGVFYLWHLRKVRARLRGSSVRVDATQFPEIHHAAESMAARLGLSECPEVYLVEGNILNAAAIKQGGQRSVVLIDDIVHGALATGNPNVLNFIIGHELAHHALGHTGFFRSKVSSRYLPLSRLDEFSCDAVAHALVADAAAARDAIILLLIGPQLFHRLDRVAFEEQVTAVVADPYSKKSESGLSHPLLLRRYARLREASRS